MALGLFCCISPFSWVPIKYRVLLADFLACPEKGAFGHCFRFKSKLGVLRSPIPHGASCNNRRTKFLSFAPTVQCAMISSVIFLTKDFVKLSSLDVFPHHYWPQVFCLLEIQSENLIHSCPLLIWLAHLPFGFLSNHSVRIPTRPCYRWSAVRLPQGS